MQSVFYCIVMYLAVLCCGKSTDGLYNDTEEHPKIIKLCILFVKPVEDELRTGLDLILLDPLVELKEQPTPGLRNLITKTAVAETSCLICSSQLNFYNKK